MPEIDHIKIYEPAWRQQLLSALEHQANYTNGMYMYTRKCYACCLEGV